MRDQAALLLLFAERLLLSGDRDAEEALNCASVRTEREARVLLDLLDRVCRAPERYSDDGIRLFVQLLEYPRTPAAARVLLREALPLLDKLAGRLPAHQSRAWAQAMHAMAYPGLGIASVGRRARTSVRH
jgi:hypothetical protein